MTKVPLLERHIQEMDLGAALPTTDAEALFREARQRRRRRRAAASAGLVLIAAIVVASVLATGGGSNGPREVATRHRGSPHATAHSNQHTQHTQTPTSLPVYPPAQTIGVADAELYWAIGDSLEVTSNGGRSWQTVTPPTLYGVTVSADITAVTAVGTNDLWVAISDVPGLVVPNHGMSRGGGIERSTDGGESWSFVALPGCLQTCGPISLSMLDAQHGFAVATSLQDQTTPVFSTQDGGATWTQIGNMPSLGGVAVDGVHEGSQLVFTSALDGWAVPGPSDGPSNEPQSPGGFVYRTTDGGLSWSVVPGLPAGLQYTLPVFFGSQDGVILATKSIEGDRNPVVFVTADGGATWTGDPIPAFEGSQFQPGSLATRFSAVGPLHWIIDVGSMLYETANGGKTWQSFRPTPAVGVGDVEGITFASPRFGLAIEQNPVCFTKAARDQPDYNCYPVLTTTSDGGRSWTPVNL